MLKVLCEIQLLHKAGFKKIYKHTYFSVTSLIKLLPHCINQALESHIIIKVFPRHVSKSFLLLVVACRTYKQKKLCLTPRKLQTQKQSLNYENCYISRGN